MTSGYISIDSILWRLKESHVSYTGGGFPSYFPPPKYASVFGGDTLSKKKTTKNLKVELSSQKTTRLNTM